MLLTFRLCDRQALEYQPDDIRHDTESLRHEAHDAAAAPVGKADCLGHVGAAEADPALPTTDVRQPTNGGRTARNQRLKTRSRNSDERLSHGSKQQATQASCKGLRTTRWTRLTSPTSTGQPRTTRTSKYREENSSGRSRTR